MYNTQKVTPASIEFMDIAGLVAGASHGEGLGNKFLSHIREVDAIVHVVRCFVNDKIIHVSGSVDPIRDIEIINLELVLADLEQVTKKYEKDSKLIRTGDKSLIESVALLEKVKSWLEAEKPVRTLTLTDDEKELLKSFSLLTAKPVIYVANISEDDIESGENDMSRAVAEYAHAEHSGVISLCARIEEELISLPKEERDDFKAELGIKESGLENL